MGQLADAAILPAIHLAQRCRRVELLLIVGVDEPIRTDVDPTTPSAVRTKKSGVCERWEPSAASN
jgi:hypothetical protein